MQSIAIIFLTKQLQKVQKRKVATPTFLATAQPHLPIKTKPMATSYVGNPRGNHQQVLENLQKSGTLNRKTVISISQSESVGEGAKVPFLRFF